MAGADPTSDSKIEANKLDQLKENMFEKKT